MPSPDARDIYVWASDGGWRGRCLRCRPELAGSDAPDPDDVTGPIERDVYWEVRMHDCVGPPPEPPIPFTDWVRYYAELVVKWLVIAAVVALGVLLLDGILGTEGCPEGTHSENEESQGGDPAGSICVDDYP